MPRKIRTIRIDGNIAYVPLTKGYEAIIDAEDVPIIGKWNWTAHVSPHTTYAKRAENNGQKHQTIYMHRFLVGGVGDLQVDHKDCIGLNNRRGNLRVAGPSENSQNQKTRKNNTSGFKGVSFEADTGKWIAQIRIDGKKVRLGSFETPELAHAAYSDASKKYHGYFGRAS